ncbi:MAG: PA0069 family radical SAM protein [Gammaproteobacteria bacterium]
MYRSTIRGRGAVSNPEGRFESMRRTVEDDGWTPLPTPAAPRTVVSPDAARSVISTNDSPDVPFEQSVNPYRGCEHGCIYCYARPGHAWLGMSPGLDFETRILFKAGAVERLRSELASPKYRCRPLAMGTYTDPYQPVEGRLEITRGILRLLQECRHPVSIVTKSALVERDLDILAPMAEAGLASVAVSVTTLDEELKRRMEPRAASPARRLKTLRRLARAGVPAGSLVAPVIPALNDHEIEAICEAVAEAGAGWADYVLLRLPLELQTLFRDWAEAHYPDRARRIMSLLRQARGGRDNDARFGHRMRGSGPWASLLEQRFAVARRRYGLAGRGRGTLDTSRFRPPGPGGQLALL